MFVLIAAKKRRSGQDRRPERRTGARDLSRSSLCRV